ncbi:MAG: excinuclease ABC subunit UvrB [Clostridia bacterium]
MAEFILESDYQLQGDQIQAVEKLVSGLNAKMHGQTLLGITGSGKTFTIANVISQVQKPTLVLAPNKTLAAQLCSEFKEFFPHNAVEYFVSYYDYYQPEAYLPSKDIHIEKDSSVNEEIDKLRHSATAALLERRDVIVVASVSCIYGIGSPQDYANLMLSLREGMEVTREELLQRLVAIQYSRNDIAFERGSFRVRGDIVEIIPAGNNEKAIRVQFFGDEIEKLMEIDVLTGEVLCRMKYTAIFPASHFVVEDENLQRAILNIEKELEERLSELQNAGKLVEAQRLEQRTKYDLEMMQEIGFCQGIENYSRHLTGRAAGERPYTLIDFFPDDFLLMVDESHLAVSQIGGMYNGDRARKTVLVDYGFRLPSALDNRPLKFTEFEALINQVVFVSATPGEYELSHSSQRVEQLIRPTGLLDPQIFVKPITGQIDDLQHEILLRIEKSQRVLITTLTKKMSESLTNYFRETGIKVKYLHSDIKTLERMAILRELRLGTFDVLIGINLLREGLDLPEVSLVAILDADKEGFLRSERSLIQTIGRAARNSEGTVIMYADRITDSMNKAITETYRRRKLQSAYNLEHGIEPQSIIKSVHDGLENNYVAEELAKFGIETSEQAAKLTKAGKKKLIARLEKEMKQAAKDWNFEHAVELRDLLIELKTDLR